jgi:hypothetical protein
MRDFLKTEVISGAYLTLLFDVNYRSCIGRVLALNGSMFFLEKNNNRFELKDKFDLYSQLFESFYLVKAKNNCFVCFG